MIKVSVEIAEDFKSNKTKELTLVIDNSTTIGMNDIYFESQKLEQSICESEELLFGKVSAASYQVKAKATTFSHKGKKLIPTIKTEHGEFQLGEFYIESDKSDVNTNKDDSKSVNREYKEQLIDNKLKQAGVIYRTNQICYTISKDIVSCLTLGFY